MPTAGFIRVRPASPQRPPQPTCNDSPFPRRRCSTGQSLQDVLRDLTRQSQAQQFGDLSQRLERQTGRSFTRGFDRARLVCLLALPAACLLVLAGVALARCASLPGGAVAGVVYLIMIAMLIAVPAYLGNLTKCPFCSEDMAGFRSGFPFHTPGSCRCCGKSFDAQLAAPPVVPGRTVRGRQIRPVYRQVPGVPYGRCDENPHSK